MKQILLFLTIFELVAVLAAQKHSHAQALSRIRAAGIGIWSSGGCSNRHNAQCTSLEQVRVRTIDQVIVLKRASGCPITITGGTETGHGIPSQYSHWNGYKLDLSLNSCLQRYITSNFRYIGRRGDGALMYKAASGNIYAKESNHWDITFY